MDKKSILFNKWQPKVGLAVYDILFNYFVFVVVAKSKNISNTKNNESHSPFEMVLRRDSKF